MDAKRLHLVVVGVLAALAALVAAPSAWAQGDVRMVKPSVVLLMDTSGSMEWMPGADGTAPVCNVGQPLMTNDRNRWNTAVEVLTGTFRDYSCEELIRNVPARIDYQYYIPHYQARWTSQDTDGIFDQYRDRVRFGFMTFDSYAGAPDYPQGTDIDIDGMWSYGNDASFFCADCMIDYTWNAGARNETAPEGRLVSVGPADDAAVQLQLNNANIQADLLAIQPYWATPIASMLNDADYYFDTHGDVNGPPGGDDPYNECRERYVILVTDGLPNVDARPFCERAGCECPWETAPQEAMDLYTPLEPNPNKRRPVLVIGYDVLDLATRRALWEIAESGGTALACGDAALCPGGDAANCGSPITCPVDQEHPGAMFVGCRDVDAATCAARFRMAFSALLDFIAGASTTRTRPAFTNAVGGGSNGQYQFDTTFFVASGAPWEGMLTRLRYECLGAVPVPVDFDGSGNLGSDDFGAILERRNLAADARDLWTFLPAGDPGVAELQTTIVATAGTDEAFTKANGRITSKVLGGVVAARRDEIVDWMHGELGTVREDKRLGDIYHANPAILGPPDLNLPDASYRDFQTQLIVNGGADRVAERPTILYAGSNDGILHAFDAVTGEEMWGFVPPRLLPLLTNQVPAAHQFGVDGGIAVRDVLPEASTIPTGADWRTVAVFGLRQGGNAYAALDVTDPFNPDFLWQFSRPEMGDSYGSPQIGTVFIDEGGTLKEKAVAVLGGGSGTPLAGDCVRGGAGLDPALMRGSVRCWEARGRYLYVVELMTGRVIAQFGPGDFDAPLVGTPALFQAQHGTSLRRIYVTDTEGTLYRVDTASTDTADWRVDRMFDLYHGGLPSASVASYEEPLLSVNEDREIVIVYGSGDPDDLAAATASRVVSITEEITLDGSGLITNVVPDVNWEIHLPDVDEKLTGPMALFDGTLYFTTFVPSAGGNLNNMCGLGYGRIWGVDLLETDAGRPTWPAKRWDVDGDPLTPDYDWNSDLAGNTVVFGVGVTRRPSCATEENITDDFGRTRTRLVNATPGEYRLVIQSGVGAPGPGWDQPENLNRPASNIWERGLAPPGRPVKVESFTNVFEQ